MATVTIDGQAYHVDGSQNLLQVCLTLGFDLPYFCWHPALGSVGSCRQCAIKQYRDADDTRGIIAMACMTPAQEGSRIAVHEPEAQAFRSSVIEWLMVNHPHDCPVCEEGGECHLQDMTQMTGHTRRRYRFTKRTHRNQYLGPFINHEMNRCIACYRCVRFYQDYAGGGDLRAFGIRNQVYFGREHDGMLENEFSGNLVEICPTGVFTDKPLARRYTRKWDLQSTPSICPHCSLGCNTSPGERYGELRRTQNRYHGEINGYFLCDRGRFGGAFVNRAERPRQPRLRDGRDDPWREVGANEAVARIGAWLAEAQGVVGIGSPRASLEGNFALQDLVSHQAFASGMGAAEHARNDALHRVLATTPAAIASLAAAEQADAVLVLGEDPTHTAPRLALSLRQATRQAGLAQADAMGIPAWHDAALRRVSQGRTSPLIMATPYATRLDDVASHRYRAAPADLARLGIAVARALDPGAPAVGDADDALEATAAAIAEALAGAERPLVVAGTASGSQAVIEAAGNVARALASDAQHRGHLCLLPSHCNGLGLARMGGHDLDTALARLERGDADTAVVLENDLNRDLPAERVARALAMARRVVVLDCLPTHIMDQAHAVLPAASFAEGDGTLINSEGRAQRYLQLFAPGAPVREAWRWLEACRAARDGDGERWGRLDAVTAACAARHPLLAGIEEAAPSALWRAHGLRVPRQPHRYSGRTAMHADRDVREHPPPEDPDSALAFSMEGLQTRRPSALIPFAWSPGWNSVQAVSHLQATVGGALAGGDPGIKLLDRGGQPGGWYAEPPARFEARGDAWLAVGIHHIFGSEVLSAWSPAIVERTPAPYLALPPGDLADRGLAGGQAVSVAVDDIRLRLPVTAGAGLAPGLAGLPVGLPGMPALTLPAWLTIEEAGP